MSADELASNWIAKHENFLLGVARGDEDAAQEARIAVWKKIQDSGARTDAYLRGVAARKVKDVLGKTAKPTSTEKHGVYDPMASRTYSATYPEGLGAGWGALEGSLASERDLETVEAALDLERLLEPLEGSERAHALARAHGYRETELPYGKRHWARVKAKLQERAVRPRREHVEKGVQWVNAKPGVTSGRWRVQSWHQGKPHFGGTFTSLAKANARAIEVREELAA